VTETQTDESNCLTQSPLLCPSSEFKKPRPFESRTSSFELNDYKLQMKD